ncbi:hypothetical protein [Streptomyces abikoensis]
MQWGDQVWVDCWSSGSDINNLGTVWYHVKNEFSPRFGGQAWEGYVYGYYVDYNNLWRASNGPKFPRC